MKDIDFSACEFIDTCLRFLTYEDFCNNAKLIKFMFEGLDHDAKRFYKFYVYANIHMQEKFKNIIWEYLNGEDPQYYVELIMNKRKVK